jgi:hypothetical protein
VQKGGEWKRRVKKGGGRRREEGGGMRGGCGRVVEKHG